MTDEQQPWEKLLRDLFGDQADDALAEMQRMGMDPATLAQAAGVGSNPGMLDHLLQQLRALMAQSEGQDVNWELAHDVARGVAAQGGDPTITAAVAAEYRAAVSAAELWLDAATDYAPATGQPHVWARAQWVEATLPTWRHLAGPVAVSVSQALGGLLSRESADADGTEQSLMRQVSPTVCGMHVGQAAGTLATESFGGTDLGLLLLPEPRVALVPSAIEKFGEGLDVPVEQLRQFVALREAAHVRLFKHAPWVTSQLHAAIAKYAAGVTIDPAELDEAVRQAAGGDPASLQKALSRGIFVTEPTDEQRAILAQIESLLALVEGWVETVVTRAGAAHLPAIGALTELMRRRRAAGGPAEDTFANLLGLELRPRRLRDAAAMFAALEAAGGMEERDGFWSHPDLLPSAEDLTDWKAWLARRADDSAPSDLDREIEALLDADNDISDES